MSGAGMGKKLSQIEHKKRLIRLRLEFERDDAQGKRKDFISESYDVISCLMPEECLVYDVYQIMGGMNRMKFKDFPIVEERLSIPGTVYSCELNPDALQKLEENKRDYFNRFLYYLGGIKECQN